ncbi:PRD domain-containing protein [uncultured Olegusella sp.]|uniref:PRD domain-containing protein n=1 Tax=uncultured Olegusella sp. TaxID=1979846 RepID=UPI00262AFD50|nr:PRD domain-containing protein [uncultured Olegusella sp.]
MLLTKKINNNVAFGTDDTGQEVVVFGKGIGFHHMPYEVGKHDEIQRVFRDVSSSIATSLDYLDTNILLAASDIVELARMELDCKLNPNLPFTLADHIQFAIQRRQEGIFISNPLSDTVAFVYPTELGLARTGVEMINRRVSGAELPDDEACAIALHLVNGELGGGGDESTIRLVIESTKIISHASVLIEDNVHITLDRTSYAFQRFAAHFRYLASRLAGEKKLNQSDNSTLFKQAAHDFPEVYLIVMQIDAYLQETYGWNCTNEELLYLMMHVNRLIMAT